MSLVAKLPYDHPYAGGYPGIGSQPLPTDADALDYLARVKAADGAGVEVGVATAVDAFFRDVKESGVFSAIRASCLLAGARTLAGALVPLKNEGPELWDATVTPVIFDDSGSAGVWTSSTQTASSSTVGTNTTFPRLKFSIGLTAGKQYRITARLTVSATGALQYIRMGYTTLVPFSVVGNVIEIDRTETVTGSPEFEIDLNATIPGVAVTIESLSIREVIASPTNVANGFVSGDYTRGGATPGLKGDGTSYLDSGRAGTDDSQNDSHISVYVSTPAGSSSRTLISNEYTWIAEDDTTTYFRLNASSSVTVAKHNVTGFIGASRSSSANVNLRIDALSTSPASASRSPGASIEVFRNWNATQYSDATIAFYSIGTSLSLEDLDTAVSNLITAIGNAL